MMAESLPQSSEEVKEERMCGPCRDEGEINVGFRYCTDCKEVLCKTCTKYHKKVKALNDHRLAELRSMSEITSDAELFPSFGKCNKHPDRDVEIYCKTHGEVVCCLCSIFLHKTCDVAEIIGHERDDTKVTKDFEVLITHLNEAIENLNLVQKLRADIKHNFEQKMTEMRSNIKQIRDKVVETMDNVVKHVSELTKQLVIEREDKPAIEMSKIAQLQEITEQKVALLDMIGQHGSERHKFVSAHLVKKQFEETEEQISEQDKHVKHLEAELIISDELRKLIDSPEVERLVQIRVTERDSGHRPLASVSASSVGTGVELNDLRDSTLVKAEEHTVSSSTEAEPWYCSVSIYKDGRVILPNFRTSGHLHLYNPTDRTQQTLQLPGAPFSAVQIDENHLAVSVPDNSTISIVTVGDELKVDRTFHTQNTPWTLAALNTGLLAVVWSDPPAFSVIDIKGTEIVQKSYMDQDASGRKFKSFYYLAVDERRQHVIQPCAREKAVYCLDLSGKPVFKYTHPELTNPQGVALDRCGNIYVCECSSSNSLHKLSPTGDLISVVTECVPSRPRVICNDVTGKGFWVTLRSSPLDQVVYFRLE